MLNTERIFWIGFAVMMLLRVSNFAGSRLFIVLFLALYSLVYWSMGFRIFNHIKLLNTFKKSTYLEVPMARLIIGGVAGWVVSVVLVGLLFAFNNYPGADLMLLIGTVSGGLFLMGSGIMLIANRTDFYKHLFIKTLPFVMVSITSYFFIDVAMR